jgi:hypothetical protein
MKLKKFNELNEATDPNDGANQLTPKVKENVAKLVLDLKKVTKEYLTEQLNKQTFSNDGSTSWKLTIKVPLERIFSAYILDYIEENGAKYGAKIHVVRDQRATMLEFIDEDSLFLIPIITTMHGDDIIYPGNNKLEFGIWVNTYVAEKVK